MVSLLRGSVGEPWKQAGRRQGTGKGAHTACGPLTLLQLSLLLKLNSLAALTRSQHLVRHAKNISQQSALPPAVKLISGL